MGLYYETTQELSMTSGYGETTNEDNEWQRWDEELVEEFGRWLSRVAKVFAILFLTICGAVSIGWL